jgi:spore coat assembly protein
MAEIKIGDLVARKSYGLDILFKVVEIISQPGRDKVYIIKGVHMRVMADAPEEDLVRQDQEKVRGYQRKNDEMVGKSIGSIMNSRKSRVNARGIKNAFLYRSRNSFGRAGKVLHIDGDKDYLDMCTEAYDKMELKAVGVHVPENQQPSAVKELLNQHLPDILVLTGHDAIAKDPKDINDINYYRNSKYYVAAVKEARRFEPSYDDLVIFAGACQSHFEAIVEAGANYASSPNRVLIHALDPVFICEKIAFSGVDSVVSAEELISKTITGVEGIGGLQTRGKYREGLPKSPYVKG